MRRLKCWLGFHDWHWYFFGLTLEGSYSKSMCVYCLKEKDLIQ